MKKTGTNAFTLIEMSVVLIIVGLVLVTVYPALKAIRTGQQFATTSSHLETVLRATAAFVQANGCLPCPCKATATGTEFGHVRGDTNPQACGDCSVAEGLVPFASLGIPPAVAKDGWSRWITMRIDPYLATNFVDSTTGASIAPPSSVCLSSDPSPCVQGESRKGMCEANLSTLGTPITITHQTTGATQKAALVLVSHGENGWGAYTTTGTVNNETNDHPAFQGNTASCNLGNYELCNADGNASFTDALYTTDDFLSFDDQLLYLNRNDLVSYLGHGACQTTW